VLVVDDHAEFRALARQTLEGGGFSVVGEAGTATQARQLTRELHPDVVILDVGLPDGNGFDLAGDLTRTARPPAVLLVSSRDWGRRSSRVRDSGACGFLPKEELSVAAVEAMLA
jgi:two-component system response regulator EvgA